MSGDALLSAWVANSGFTAVELAMIQPGIRTPDRVGTL